ncbi:polyprenyl synthetase family protein [Leucobacter rhizosphaerae]|uniref:Polyprenyl synthetase family protein n=1 Tax=Leucobacter rhizosphaerae TaxID=2932245 RepID=A0ABY4FT29_9MICO|nr:polyprenyl synthetase family protein [Leucobacter rhizosphaerae]UOQ59415.1 polyprenyl synthetase family protein [Leucobacter rhizosphaerae]
MSTAVRTESDRVRLRLEVEGEIDALLARTSRQAQTYGTEFLRLWSHTAQHVRGGKLLRPILLLETYDALRPDGDRREALRLATAVEALHFAFLLHDDVIDQDLRRRGELNLVGELVESATAAGRGSAARHWAETGAILAGDLLLSSAHQIVARVRAPEATRERLLDLLEHTILETTAGEFSDVGLSDGMVAPDLDAVLVMTKQKTASYTFELPLRAAAILAGGSPELEHALSIAGAHLGLAYQLQDDLLSVFGDADEHGKDPYSDLREGKHTAVICFAQRTSAWPVIARHFGDPQLQPEDAVRVRRLLTDCGAEDHVRALIDDQLAALTELVADEERGGAIPARVRAMLLDLAARIDGRRS